MKSQKAILLETINELLGALEEEYNSGNQDTHPLNNTSLENKNNEKLVYAAVQKYGFPLQYASKELQDNKRIVLEAVSRCSGAYREFDNALRYASERLKDDKEVVLKAIIAEPISLEYASKRLQDDKEVVLEALLMKDIMEHGCFYMYYLPALEFASQKLQDDDDEVVAAAISIVPESLEFASKRL
ncbi:MAG: hypothetical protein COB07_11880 [Sulfurovum sp.]|nr:MAG: hypothetical protein COB07_11880 [Sulfurovum sp.]